MVAPSPEAPSDRRAFMLANVRKARDRQTGEIHWIWTGALQTPEAPDSYGLVRYPTTRDDGITAHRAFYLEFRGPLRADQDAHHTCRIRRCVNPEHLRAVKSDPHRRAAGRLPRSPRATADTTAGYF